MVQSIDYSKNYVKDDCEMSTITEIRYLGWLGSYNDQDDWDD